MLLTLAKCCTGYKHSTSLHLYQRRCYIGKGAVARSRARTTLEFKQMNLSTSTVSKVPDTEQASVSPDTDLYGPYF